MATTTTMAKCDDELNKEVILCEEDDACHDDGNDNDEVSTTTRATKPTVTMVVTS